jgi:transcriptional regulator with GAF, ATPase, and Fis domain
MVGQLNQGLGMLDAIRSYCLEKGNTYLAAQAGSAIAMALLPMNRIDDALRYLKQSLKEAGEGGNYWTQLTVTFVLALAHFRKGNKKKSIDYLRRFLQHSREAYVSLGLYPYLIEICWAMETGNLPTISGLSLEQEIHRMLSVRNVFVRGIAYRYQALLGKHKGWSSQQITRSLSLSARQLKESGNRIELAKTYLELARHYFSLDRENKGKKNLRIASDILSSYNINLIPDELKTLVGTQNPEKVILDEILDLGSDMAGNRDNKKILNQIVATANRITGAERGAILLVEQGASSSKLILRASKNLTVEQIAHPSFNQPKQIIHEVVTSGKGRIFETGSVKETGSHLNKTIRSVVCVPLTCYGKTLGVLYHDNRLLGSVFKESDLKLLNCFSGLAALELHNEKCRQELHSLRQQSASKENLPAKKNIQPLPVHGLVGKSTAFRRVLTQIEQVAATDSSILIQGETGVGKNLIAEAIHRQSARSKGPLISVQCSALTETLITSELFGHEKGSFTGATYRRIGRFELADQGTLFLDEIGDLSLDVQARLLRVLQSREFERVGGGRETLTSDFRLIAATNRDLSRYVKEKKFREDLYYRINVFPIHVPPLRERREDIPLLVHHFLGIYAKNGGRRIDEIPKQEMEKLLQYDWPGNVRELENILQRSLIQSQGLDFVLANQEPVPYKPYASKEFHTFEENERQHILEALRRTRWKIHGPGGAAEMLDMNPSTLSSRMKKLQIKKPARASLII